MALIMLSVSFLNFLCTCFLSNVLFREYSITASVFCILACYMRNPFGHFNFFNGSAHEACRQNDKTCKPTIKNCLFAIANLPTHFAPTQIIILLFQNKFSFFMAVSLKS